MKTLSLYLVRHAEPADVGLFYGHLDVDLSPRGLQQIARQVAFFRKLEISRIYASDLLRARRGASAIASDHGLEVECTAALREMHLGALEGVSHEAGRANFPELAARSYLDMFEFRMTGGGESVADTAARVVPFVEQVVAHRLALHEPGVVLVYAHNTVVRLLLALAAGVGAAGYGRFAQDYAAINRVDFDPSRGGDSPWAGATIVFSNLRP